MALVLANPANATVYLLDNPVPNPANTLVIFQVCVAVVTVFDVCALKDDLLNKLKPSTLLPLNCGSCEFTIDAVTNLTALVLFYKNHKQFGQTPNPNALGQVKLDEYV
jgi:hypothetical protein